MQLRLIGEKEVLSLLPMRVCIELMRHAMVLSASGKALQPIRTGLPLPNGRGLLGMMPGYIADPEWLGIKVASVFPGNFGTTLGSHQGMILLFEVRSGQPIAIIDAKSVTAIRTAAASAVATNVLARSEARSLGVLGYGEQAANHVEAISLVRNLDRVVIWGRSFDKAKEFAVRQSLAHNIDVQAALDINDAVRCDIVCTTTAADEPLFPSTALCAGVHLNIVGSSIPSTAEIDSQTVLRSRFYVDYKDSALALAGEFKRAKELGLVNDEHILGSIGDVLLGRAVGRTSEQDITLFKSLGMIAEDLVAADYVYALAQKNEVGSIVTW